MKPLSNKLRDFLIRAMFWFNRHEFWILARITLVMIMTLAAVVVWMILYLFSGE